MAKHEAADKAIQAYDAFIFSSIGRPFNSFKADMLALSALEACKEAAADYSVNQHTRCHYARLRDQFALIA
jgi:hypothetical protein